MIVLLGFIFRFDHYGVSSFVRWLGLDSAVYLSLLHFFHTDSWSLDAIMKHWIQWCSLSFQKEEVNGRSVLMGDDIKVPKEALRQPGMSSCYQESSVQSKPEKFLGHVWGQIALLTGSPSKWFATPMLTSIQEGVNPLRQLQENEIAEQTTVTRMVYLGIIVAVSLGCPSYLVLDAYFATGPAFLAATKFMVEGQPWVHLISKGKRGYVAYASEHFSNKGRTYGIKLWVLFKHPEFFTTTTHPTKGNPMSFYSLDLFWPPAKTILRFVWVIHGNGLFLLMGSDLTLAPLEMIRLYSLRSKIEVLFRVLRQNIGAYLYRFWTLACPKRSRKKGNTASTDILGPNDFNAMLPTLLAIERFVNLAGIATGLLHFFALNFTDHIWKIHHASSWIRTYSSEIPSEEVTQRALQTQLLIARPKSIGWIKQLTTQINLKKKNRRKVTPDPTLPPSGKPAISYEMEDAA